MDSNDTSARLQAQGAHVLLADHVCHECGCIVPVFAVMLAGPFKSQERELVSDDDAPLLRRMSELPNALMALLDAKSGGSFRPDFSHTLDDRYWMNHCCECDAKIGDWFVHKPGEAFFPTTDREMAQVRGTRIEGPFVFNAPDLSVSSWTTEWVKRFPEDADC